MFQAFLFLNQKVRLKLFKSFVDFDMLMLLCMAGTVSLWWQLPPLEQAACFSFFSVSLQANYVLWAAVNPTCTQTETTAEANASANVSWYNASWTLHRECSQSRCPHLLNWLDVSDSA